MNFFCDIKGQLSAALTPDAISKSMNKNASAYEKGKYAGTGVPFLNQALAAASTMLGSAASNLVNSIYNSNFIKGLPSVNQASATIASALAVFNVTAEAQQYYQAMYINNMKEEVGLRLLILRELQYHVVNILYILQIYGSGGPLKADNRIIMALPYVKKAYQDLSILDELMKPPKPRYRASFKQDAIKNLTNAITILNGGAVSDQTYKINRGVKLRAVITQLTDKLAAEQLYTHIVNLELFTWHYTRLVSIFAGGPVSAVNLSFPGNIGTPNWLSTFSQKQFPQLQAQVNAGIQARSADYIAKQKAWRVEITGRANKHAVLGSMLTIYASLDSLLGLLPTSAVIDTYADVIRNFQEQWSQLLFASQAVIDVIAPTKDMVNSVKTEMITAADNATTSANIAQQSLLSIPSWVTVLQTAENNLNIVGQIGSNLEPLSNNNDALAAIIAYLNDPTYAKGAAVEALFETSFIGNSARLLLALGTQSLSVAGIVTANGMNKQLLNALAFNEKLLTILQAYDVSNDPVIAAITNEINNLVLANPLASRLANLILGGNINNATQVMAGIVTAGIAGFNQLNKMMQGCPAAADAKSLANNVNDPQTALYATEKNHKSGLKITEPKLP